LDSSLAAAPITWLGVNGGLTLIGPMLAIALALATRKILPSLGLAILAQAMVVGMQEGSLSQGLGALVTQLSEVVFSPDNATIAAFSLLVAALVGLLEASGATSALIARVRGVAKGPRGAMTASWMSGAIIFFDDYANCMVVGSTMKSLCDRAGVSRAKLAYIVDATAAPIASLAIISTWVGYEIQQLQMAIPDGSDMQPFALFIAALPYRAYCILTIVFVGAIAWSGKDFGPMLREEAAARAKHQEMPEDGAQDMHPSKHWDAILSVGTLVVATFALLYQDGRNALVAQGASSPYSLFDVLSSVQDPFTPMLYGSAGAFLLALLLSARAREATWNALGKGAAKGAGSILIALVVLYLAWTLGGLIKASGAGDFLAALLGDTMTPWLLPPVTFALAALTAFSTGSSYFTMAALIPLVVPLAFAMSPSGGVIVLATAAAVLDGAVLGDHASPISDTTILSSMGAGIDVAKHVETQLPYVLLVGFAAIVSLSVCSAMGLSPFLVLPIAALSCVGCLLRIGKRPEPLPTPGNQPA